MKKLKVSVSLIVTLLLVGCSSNKIKPVSSLYRSFSTCYNIFPIAFADSNNDGKGDLRGIINQLDYLEDLGIDCIWLNPIHPSNTYHKYDVIDYYAVDPDFGTIEDFKELITEAKKRDIALIIDFVINHTSSSHEWFMKSKAGDKKYRDYYRWRSKDDPNYTTLEGWVKAGDEYYFASFWDQMPELNYENKKVREEIKKIAKYWLDLGVAGFRIDAAIHVYDPREYPKDTDVLGKGIDWFKEFNAYVKSINKDAIIISEIWRDTNTVARFLPGMDSAFNFDLADAIVKGVKDRDASNIAKVLKTSLDKYAEARSDYIDSIFLTNHDMNRVMSTLNENTELAKLAAHVLFTLPGVVWVYYGEELGMIGEKPDENIREPFLWYEDHNKLPQTRWKTIEENTNTPSLEIQKNVPDSMYNTYKTLINLRKTNEALYKGDYVHVPSKFFVLSFIREYKDEKLFVIHNFSKMDREIVISGNLNSLLYSSHSENTYEGNTIYMKTSSTMIFKISENIIITN